MKRSGQGTSQEWGRISKRMRPHVLSGFTVTAPNNEPDLPLREAVIALLTLIVFLACLTLAALAWM
jgi:hypothetical protein